MKRTISTLAGCAAALALFGEPCVCPDGPCPHRCGPARHGRRELALHVGSRSAVPRDPRCQLRLDHRRDRDEDRRPATAARAVRLHDLRCDGRIRRGARAAGVRPHAVLVPGLHDAGLAAERQLVTREPAVGARAAHHGRHDPLPRPRDRVGRRERGSERRRHPPELPLEARDRGRLGRPGVPFRPPRRSGGKAVLQRDRRRTFPIRSTRRPWAWCATCARGGCPWTASGCSITSRTRMPTRAQVEEAIVRLGDLGVDVHISELDVPVWYLGSTPERKLARQAAVYRSVAEACNAQPACFRITTWGFMDRYTWRQPWDKSLPLPFDSEYRPKPAWTAIQEALHPAGAPPPPPPPPLRQSRPRHRPPATVDAQQAAAPAAAPSSRGGAAEAERQASPPAPAHLAGTAGGCGSGAGHRQPVCGSRSRGACAEPRDRARDLAAGRWGGSPGSHLTHGSRRQATA